MGLKSLFRGEDAAKKRSLEERLGRETSARLIGHIGIEQALIFADNAFAEAHSQWARYRARREDMSPEEQEEYDRASAESGTVTIATRALFICEFMARRVLTPEEHDEYLDMVSEHSEASTEERIALVNSFVAEKIAGNATSEWMKRVNLPDDRDLYLDLGARVFLALGTGGQPRFTQPAEAVTVARSSAPAKTVDDGAVTFDADGRVAHIDLSDGSWVLEERGQARYYTQRAASLLHASEILQAVPSVPENTYYVVDTPDGSLCRDIFGIYTEGPVKTTGLALVNSQGISETTDAVSLTAYGDAMKSQMSIAQLKMQGHYANFVLLMECGRCGYKSPVETQAGAMQRQCYCCGAMNTSTRGNITVQLGSAAVDI